MTTEAALMNDTDRKFHQQMAKQLRAMADMHDEKAGTIDVAKVIFQKGRQVLAEHMPESRRGAFIGKLVKAVGHDKALDAIQEAAYKADPVSWLGAVMAHRMGWREYARVNNIGPGIGEEWPEYKDRVLARMAKDGVRDSEVAA